MAKKNMEIVNRAIVTPDKHFPLHDKKAINVVCKAIKIIKPSIYIDLGDTGEWEHFRIIIGRVEIKSLWKI